jgi:hypothetical protein
VRSATLYAAFVSLTLDFGSGPHEEATRDPSAFPLLKGYNGGGVDDHIDHIRAMGDTMEPYLKRRWAR